MKTNYSDRLQVIKAKDLQTILTVSERKAEKIHRDIRQEYGVKLVTMGAVWRYLGNIA